MFSKGFLDVPVEFVKADDNELGFLYTAEEQIYLFGGAPSQAAIDGLRTGKYKEHRIDKNEAYPTIICDENGQPIACIQGILERGQQVLARHLRNHEKVYEVVTFQPVNNKREGMPESGKGIKITAKGYVFKDKLHQSNIGFQKLTSDIFPHEDLTNDVKQGNFGDCFLLASVLGILTQKGGSAFIKSMMRQEGTYTYVRLYHPETRQPVVIRVQNTEYCEDGESCVNHLAPWVHILEKAYTAFAYKYEKNNFVYSYPAFREVYGAGGQPTTALKILTGQDAKDISVPGSAQIPWNGDNLMFCYSLFLRTGESLSKYRENLANLDQMLLDKKNNMDKLTVFVEVLQLVKVSSTIIIAQLESHPDIDDTILGFIKQLLTKIEDEKDKVSLLEAIAFYIEKFISLYCKSLLPISKVLDKMEDIFNLGKHVDEIVKAGHIDAIFTLPATYNEIADVTQSINTLKKIEPNLPEYFADKFFNYLRKPKLASTAVIHEGLAPTDPSRVNGPAGSGLYSDAALILFNKIKQHCASLACVAATRETVGKDEVVHGLRPAHAYAVLGVNEIIVNGRELKMIRLRNPWARYGVEYVFENMRMNASEDAVFEVELSDFVKYFDEFSFGAFIPVPQPALQLKQSAERSFISEYWGLILAGASGVGLLAVAGVFTFGIVPAIATGIAVALGVSYLVATVLGITTIGIGAFVLGLPLVGGIIKAVTSCMSTNKKPVNLPEERQPLLQRTNSDVERINDKDDSPRQRSKPQDVPQTAKREQETEQDSYSPPSPLQNDSNSSTVTTFTSLGH